MCAAAGMEALLPLWQGGREDLLVEFLDAGFQATIVTVNGRMLSPDFLGRTLDRPLIAEVVAAGVDACGEYGEFHTVVTDGPLFTAPVRLRPAATLEYDGYWFLDMALDA